MSVLEFWNARGQIFQGNPRNDFAFSPITSDEGMALPVLIWV